MCIARLSHSPNFLIEIKAFAPTKSPVQISLCQMFCSLAKANAVTAVIVLGSCEFCQVRIMNMQNKGEIWPDFLSSFSMFSICQIRLKEKKKKKERKNQKPKKNKFSLHFERQMGLIRSSLGSCIPLLRASLVTLLYSIAIFVQSPRFLDDLKDFF